MRRELDLGLEEIAEEASEMAQSENWIVCLENKEQLENYKLA